MDAEERRSRIRDALLHADRPFSAGRFASMLGVSRQIIVGDIALLRASGLEVISTPRGYVLPRRDNEAHIHRIVCQHSAKEMRQELYTIVDNGCTVLDVVVEHPIYGELTGALQLSSRYDVDQFIRRSEEQEAQPLSALTEGIHLHTIRCSDEEAFERTVSLLRQQGVLLEDK